MLRAAAPDEGAVYNWAAAYIPEIDNIRIALTWVFAPAGDVKIGVALAAASAPIWLEMSLLTECHGWMGKALYLLDAGGRETRQEMMLQTALGYSLMFTEGTSSRARTALMRASELAEIFEDFNSQLRAYVSLTAFSIRLEEFRDALAFARRSEALAENIANPGRRRFGA